MFVAAADHRLADLAGHQPGLVPGPSALLMGSPATLLPVGLFCCYAVARTPRYRGLLQYSRAEPRLPARPLSGLARS